MSQEQAERALQSLYEESGARDELTDDEAEILLKWAESQIQRLADQNLDDEGFDEAYSQMVKLLTRMNRFAARRVDLPSEDQKTSLARIAESASAVGLAIPEAQMTAYLEQPVAQGAGSDIQGLITLVAGSEEAAGTTNTTPIAVPEAQKTADPEQSVAQNVGTVIQGFMALLAGHKEAANTTDTTPSDDIPEAESNEIVPTEKADLDDQEIQ